MHGAGGGRAKANADHRASLEVARRECEALGIPIEIDPGEALMRELFETAGNVAFYRSLVQQLPSAPAGHGGDGVENGIYSRTYHVSGLPTGEAKPHVLVELYNRERTHLLAVSSAAIKAGVEERRVRLAEGDAQRIFDAQVRALQAIGMGDKLDQFRHAFGDALRGDVVAAALPSSGDQ